MTWLELTPLPCHSHLLCAIFGRGNQISHMHDKGFHIMRHQNHTVVYSTFGNDFMALECYHIDNHFILLLSNLEVKFRVTMLQTNLPEMCLWMMISALGPPLCKTQML